MANAKAALTLCALTLALAPAVSGSASQRGARAPKAGRAAVKRMEKMPEGTWGGRGVRLDVTRGGARIEFDCAHGTLEGPLTLGGDRRFEARGTFTRERGGPTRVPEDAADGQTPPDEGDETLPARYAGRVTGKSMTLTVTALGSGDVLGTFSLTRGRPAILVKCL